MATMGNTEFETYDAEVRQRWGETDAYRDYAKRVEGYSKQKRDSIAEEMDDIFAEFAICMKNGEAPDSAESQETVKALQSHITENYYLCTNEILASLGQMYVADARFKSNIDKHAEGTADFASKAIGIYCEKQTDFI